MARPSQTAPSVIFVSMILSGLFRAVAATACAVNVHRFILLNEPPASLRVSRVEWRYLLRVIWICLPFALAGMALAMMVGFGLSSGKLQQFGLSARSVIIGLEVMCGLGAIFFFVEFSLSLPAAAIGHGEFKASHGLDASDGNSLRLLVLALAGLAGPWLVGQACIAAIVFAIHDLPTLVVSSTGFALMDALSLFQAIVWAALLSFGYAGLVQRNPAFLVADPALAG